ncbi:hypothetical protein SKAU_G00373170 [Synaphobranchus kaupii]|uniref:Uncharacterized protein n=1 Tax=Synaphobranchus kaupii TaxID=118154 RepID=A0A9Q1EGD3_SYNKA|nr:hypothetical protein SKAU_G00373170 [Synaphobranchus kaupii]
MKANASGPACISAESCCKERAAVFTLRRGHCSPHVPAFPTPHIPEPADPGPDPTAAPCTLNRSADCVLPEPGGTERAGPELALEKRAHTCEGSLSDGQRQAACSLHTLQS